MKGSALNDLILPDRMAGIAGFIVLLVALLI